VKALGLWDSVREIARMYDAGMGAIIFVPIVFFSWFPFVSTFQSRFLFNQAFSRGLEISLILAAANSMISCSCPDISACLLIGDLRWIVYILVNWTCNGSLYNALVLVVRFELCVCVRARARVLVEFEL